MLPPDTEEHQSSGKIDRDYTTTDPVGKSVDWSEAVDNQQTEENIMQISGTGHWFLEGWIGDHAVDFLVDSGSAVTAISRSFFNRLSEAGHRSASYVLQQGDCAALMDHTSIFLVALPVWCHFWV